MRRAHLALPTPTAGLLCIQQAKEGGVSSFASTLAVHNEMVRRGRQDLVRCLAGPGWFRDRSRYQDLPEGADPVWEMPVFRCVLDGYPVLVGGQGC